MKAILASHTGGSKRENGKRIPMPMSAANGFVRKLQKEWVSRAKVLILFGNPDDFDKNDAVCACCRCSFPMSGLDISYMEICDSRNEALANEIKEMDVLLLAGGHVPSQNQFFHIAEQPHSNRVGLFGHRPALPVAVFCGI